MAHGINLKAMFRIYIKTAFRNIIKSRFFSSINIVGLAVGITVSLLMLIYVVNELSYESFHKNRKNIYRIALEWGTESSTMKFAGSLPGLAPAINSEIPEVENAVRFRKEYNTILKNQENEEFEEENFFFADAGIFDVFSFNLKVGNPDKVLADPYSVVVSEEMAAKYFGGGSVPGQELYYNDIPLKVTGIIGNVPENTHLRCDFLVSYSTLEAMGLAAAQPWGNWGQDFTYFLLKEGASLDQVSKKINELLYNNAGEWLASRMKLVVQPLSAVHWDTESRGDFGVKGNKAYVYIFLSAAIFILLIACFNFMNLSISKYLDRMKEVGIRKVAGAQQRQLVRQFMTESMAVILISVLAGILLFESSYSKLYSYLNTNFVLNEKHFAVLALIVTGIIILVGIIAGGYPALTVSRHKPVEIIRNGAFGSTGKLTFRKLLILLQFSISVVLLVGTIVIFRQLNYMKNSDLGFNKEGVVMLNFPGNSETVIGKYDVLKDELLKNPNIISVSGAYTVPGINSQMNISVKQEGAPDESSINVQALPADYGFAESMGLEVVNGRDFSEEFSRDRYGSALLNQTAVKVLGLENPVGARLKIPGDDFKNGVTVVGIVKDFHVQSFHNKINPMLIYMNPRMYICMALRINPENSEQTLAGIKTAWEDVLPTIQFNCRYLRDAYYNLYSSEEKSGQLLSAFTVLALFISCLGLFGFSSYIVSKRIKEVGIRKVMGARITGISVLLSRQFTVWVLASGIVAIPAAFILVNEWLQNFAFHVNIKWWFFAIAIGFELLIALLTVSWQSWRAAIRNPVEALRYE